MLECIWTERKESLVVLCVLLAWSYHFLLCYNLQENRRLIYVRCRDYVRGGDDKVKGSSMLDVGIKSGVVMTKSKDLRAVHVEFSWVWISIGNPKKNYQFD